MLKKTVTYVDYNGAERTEAFYFNMSKAEIMETELSVTGGFSEMVEKVVSSQDAPSLMKIFKDIILKSYGEKSPDGKRFIKSAELSEAFSQTEAYSKIFMELMTNTNAAIDFVNGVIPNDIPGRASGAGNIAAISETPSTTN